MYFQTKTIASSFCHHPCTARWIVRSLWISSHVHELTRTPTIFLSLSLPLPLFLPPTNTYNERNYDQKTTHKIVHWFGWLLSAVQISFESKIILPFLAKCVIRIHVYIFGVNMRAESAPHANSIYISTFLFLRSTDSQSARADLCRQMFEIHDVMVPCGFHKRNILIAVPLKWNE